MFIRHDNLKKALEIQEQQGQLAVRIKRTRKGRGGTLYYLVTTDPEGDDIVISSAVDPSELTSYADEMGFTLPGTG